MSLHVSLLLKTQGWTWVGLSFQKLLRPCSVLSRGSRGRIAARRGAPHGRYLVPFAALVPRFEHQLPVSVPALVQALQLLQVDPLIQSVLQAPLRGVVLMLARAAVPVSVSVPGHTGFTPQGSESEVGREYKTTPIKCFSKFRFLGEPFFIKLIFSHNCISGRGFSK